MPGEKSRHGGETVTAEGRATWNQDTAFGTAPCQSGTDRINARTRGSSAARVVPDSGVDVCVGCEYFITGTIRFVAPNGDIRCRYCWVDRRQSLNYDDRTDTRAALVKKAQARTGWTARVARAVHIQRLRGGV